MLKNVLGILCIALPALLFGNTDDELLTKKHVGRAYRDAERRNPVYSEMHTAYYRQGTLVKSTNDYFDMQGQKIAELNSDYTRSIVMPTYISIDHRSGDVEGLRFDGQDYWIFRQKRGEDEEVSRLSKIENVFACQGWHYYLVANLSRLRNEQITMSLIFPTRLDYYDFRVRPVEDSERRIKLRLEFDSFFLRLLTQAALELTYDKVTKKIVSYYGPSNLVDESGSVQDVYIFYE